MGKDLDSLQTSRDRRAEIQSKYGFIPTSIIEAEKNKLLSTDQDINERSYYSTEYFGNSDKDHRLFGISGKGCGAGALSRYPQNVGRYLVKMYSNEAETILDPFAGHNCLPGDSVVICQEKAKSIAKIKVGDKVLTHKGNYKTVVKTFKHNNNNLIELLIAGNPKLQLTAEHPILAIKTVKCPYCNQPCLFNTCCIKNMLENYQRKKSGELNYRGTRSIRCKKFYEQYHPQFIPAKELSANDLVCFPVEQIEYNIEKLAISEFVDLCPTYYNVGQETITVRVPARDGIRNTFNRYIALNEDFLELCGYYLAEGDNGKRDSIQLTFHVNEDILAQRTSKLITKCLGIRTEQIRLIKDNSVQRVSFTCSALSRLFGILFGEGSFNKHIPFLFQYLPRNKLQALLKGYFKGDGCISNKGAENRVIVTVSPSLACQVKQLCLKIGMLPSIQLDRKHKINCNHNDVYSISFNGDDIDKIDSILGEPNVLQHHHKFNALFIDSYACYRILASGRLNSNKKVYNLEVVDDNSYTVLQGSLHNSRMELVYRLGRHYIGYDISHKFMESNRKLSEELQGSKQGLLFNQQNTIVLVEDDARNIKINNFVDMVLTSPPYWDIEYYGNEPEQLGIAKNYADFMYGIRLILEKCFTNLKRGGFCCWSINDFRRNGMFYPYHSDLIQAYRITGFTLHDIIIVDLGVPIGAAFASQLEEQRRTAKRHEYVIVGLKP